VQLALRAVLAACGPVRALSADRRPTQRNAAQPPTDSQQRIVSRHAQWESCSASARDRSAPDVAYWWITQQLHHNAPAAGAATTLPPPHKRALRRNDVCNDMRLSACGAGAPKECAWTRGRAHSTMEAGSQHNTIRPRSSSAGQQLRAMQRLADHVYRLAPLHVLLTARRVPTASLICDSTGRRRHCPLRSYATALGGSATARTRATIRKQTCGARVSAFLWRGAGVIS
jgi:hypothetical protein